MAVSPSQSRSEAAAPSLERILAGETSGTSKDLSAMVDAVCSPQTETESSSVVKVGGTDVNLDATYRAADTGKGGAVVAEKEAGWDTIAREWQVIEFPNASSRTVRFGHEAHGWLQATISDAAFYCARSSFGNQDPAPGVAKTCEEYVGVASSGWSYLVSEWQSKEFADPNVLKRVRFGHASRGWYEKNVSNYMSCTSQFFDGQDPAQGLPKVCELQGTAPAPTPAPAPSPVPAPAPAPGSTWNYLAAEWNTVSLPDGNPRTVRFGHPSVGWTQRTVTNEVNCTKYGFLGVDPAVGTVKICEILGDATTAPPAPPAPPPAPTPAPSPAPTPAPTPAPAPAPMPGGVYIDTTKIPTGSPGLARDVIQAATESPYYSDGIGAFRTVCDYSHMNFDDAIIYPGQPGKSHLHTYFGNKSANANSTPENLLAGGSATCRGGTVNRSGYWVPSMIDTRDGTPLAPTRMVVYYKTGYWGLTPQQVTQLPVGLRMIGGSSSSKKPQGLPVSHYTCSADNIQLDGVPTSCPVGATIDQVIRFPQCWDGKNLDSPDHRSHMSYPKPDFPHGCPATHPVGLPEVQFMVSYPVRSNDDLRSWRLSSDAYETTSPGGYSNHADWINGWKSDVMNIWHERCVRKGLDCKGALLGDGRALSGTYGEGAR